MLFEYCDCLLYWHREVWVLVLVEREAVTATICTIRNLVVFYFIIAVVGESLFYAHQSIDVIEKTCSALGNNVGDVSGRVRL